MFDDFYGFSTTPFSRTIPSSDLYRWESFDELLDRLKYAAKRQLFAVLTGGSGTGKTTALRRFRDELRGSEFSVLYLADSKLTPRTFYKGLLEQLGVVSSFYSGEAKRQLHHEIAVLKGVHGLTPVTIVDESHLLTREMLEEVRFLLNCNMDSQSPMALILAGQTELWDKLKLQTYAAIRQRVELVCLLGPLDRAQTSEYIRAHLAFARCDKEIYTDAAIDEIFKFSGGIPRLINKACLNSLMYGSQNRKTIIDDRMVKLVIAHELLS